jgi:hypothetical protein
MTETSARPIERSIAAATTDFARGIATTTSVAPPDTTRRL